MKSINSLRLLHDIDMIKILNICLLTLSLLTLSQTLHALKTDSDQPIDITADSLEMNDSKRISTYTGNVTFKQGSLNIKSESLVLYFDENNELDYMEMTGNPAQLKQQNEEQKWMNGSANHITYKDKESLLTLKDDAEFTSGNDHITSNFIKINTDNEQIQAGEKDNNSRVHIKILPRSKK